jgi:hypothetical protein
MSIFARQMPANTAAYKHRRQSSEDQAELNQSVALLVQPQDVPDQEVNIETHCN